jgi:hypothetical protein
VEGEGAARPEEFVIGVRGDDQYAAHCASTRLSPSP